MTVSWLKKGAAAHKLEETAKKAQEEKAKNFEHRGLFRFMVKPGEEARFTFVDGALNEQDLLDQYRYYEHHLFWQGSWNNFFLCQAMTDPAGGHVCPICEMKDQNVKPPSLVALFTVIDHRTSKSKDGTKTYKDTRKLFVAKPATYELLQKLAAKRGGLAGVTFDAMRANDSKSPSVGSQFDFIEKNPPEILIPKYMREWKDKDGNEHKESSFKVADYEKEIVVKSEDELRAMGFGAKGYKDHSMHSQPDNTDYASQM